jgi:hypothetical protein
MSIYLGTGSPNVGNAFDGHAFKAGIKKKMFFYISQSRYLTYVLIDYSTLFWLSIRYELLAKNVVDAKNYQVIMDFPISPGDRDKKIKGSWFSVPR